MTVYIIHKRGSLSNQVACEEVLIDAATSQLWRRKQQPSPVFLPGESQGRQSLVGCQLWGRTESDTTEVT